MNSRTLALAAVLVALAVGTNYAMMSFYNVKFMDLIVFVGGFCFGPIVGGLIGIACWGVYGSINPLGFSFHIWVATMFAESLYGVAGGLLGRLVQLSRSNEVRSGGLNLHVFFAATGIFLTVVYDAITNIVFGRLFNWSIIFSLISGFVPFGLLHVVSNALFFGVACAPAIKTIKNMMGGEGNGISEK